MTDDDELRERTAGGDRLDQAGEREQRRGLVDDVVTALDEIDAGDRQKTVSVWDGPLSAYVAALEENPEARAALADGLGDALDREVPADLDRSDLLRLLLRAGLATSAPDHLDAIREAVREQAVEPL